MNILERLADYIFRGGRRKDTGKVRTEAFREHFRREAQENCTTASTIYRPADKRAG